MNQIRLLNSDEIECRVGTISEKGLSLLLYKDARADMKILDETFGVMNWERQHELIGDNLYCIVRIWDENKHQWIQEYCEALGKDINGKEKQGEKGM